MNGCVTAVVDSLLLTGSCSTVRPAVVRHLWIWVTSKLVLWITSCRYTDATGGLGLVDDESSRQRLIRLVSDMCALVR